MIPGRAPIRVAIDGRACDVPAGVSVLEALRFAGVEIPALCHDDRLAPTGACRSCLVRVEGVERLLPACVTPVADGQQIRTDDPEIAAFRRFVFSSLARRYPADAAAASPGKPFNRWLTALGLEGCAGGHAPEGLDSSHPLLSVDMSKCIDCCRCVRICEDVQGQDVWHVRERGAGTVIRPDGPTLRLSPCVACGACADTCPTGAIDDAGAAGSGPADAWTRTTCPYCGTGCEMLVGAKDGAIVSIVPAMDAPVSRGHLCVKGRYAFDFVSAEDRITDPMIRTASGWQPVSWPDAIGAAAEHLRHAIDRDGPDSVGVLGSARATNEDNYLTQKFARTVLGTHNVDCCARVCHAPSAAGLKRMLGAGLATGSFDDIERAATLVVVGANPTENHPIVGARIRQAVRRGARLVVVDPRRIELAEIADVHLALRPGTNVALLNAIAHVIVAEGLIDRRFADDRVDGLAAFAASVAPWTPERAAGVCGVAAGDVRAAARLIARGPTLCFHGLGLTEHVQGTDGVMALVNVALLTGNVGRPGAGVNPLRGQNNVQGAAHMGCDPAVLPGSTPIAAGRAAFERAWAHALPATPGLTMMEMMDAARAGRLKGLWAIGYDVLLTNPHASWMREALSRLDFVLVQDLFMTETAREFGSVFLPACSSFEKDGTFMNAERRIQRVRRVLEPRGQSRPDWLIVGDLARAMQAGAGFDFAGPEAIWDEVRSLCEGARGMSYARLESSGLQWPCASEDDPGAERLHADRFACGDRAALRAIEWRPDAGGPDPAYPFVLLTGRTLTQFNANTMTGRSRVAGLRATDYLDIAPSDAEALGIEDGERVTVRSACGQAVLPAHVCPAMKPGELFATFHTRDVFLNEVTGDERDPVTGTPAYKTTPVTIARTDPKPGACPD